MNKDMAKAYTVFVAIGLIILIPVISIIYNAVKDKRLYEDGIKVEAIVKDSERRRNVRTRILHYSLTLTYTDNKGKAHTERMGVNNETFLANPKGKKIEILIDKEDPSSFTLVNTAKFYGTEERVVSPTELQEFNESQDKEYILSELNKISVGWTMQESDSNSFINKKRKSFIRIMGDSITYFGRGIKYDDEFKENLRKLERTHYGQFYPGYLTEIPFGKLNPPKQRYSVKQSYYIYRDDSYEFMMFSQIDYSHQPWVILSAKKHADSIYN